MDLSSIPLFSALTKRMDWLSRRQSVLAENVANANTPGYHAKDLRQPSFAGIVANAAQPLQLASTEAGRLVPANDAAGGLIASNADLTLSGNGVVLDDQMMKVSDTANDYALMTTLYRSNMSLLTSAIGHS